jgi:hypothetical protein
MRKKAFHILFTLALAVGQTLPAYGQADVATATLKGTITDQNDAVVIGATVTVKNLERGITRTDRTNSLGLYVIPLLQPGPYEVRIEATGFETKVISRIELTVGQVVVSQPVAGGPGHQRGRRHDRRAGGRGGALATGQYDKQEPG